MTTLFQLTIITTIWILGITIVTQKGMWLYFLRQAAQNRVDRLEGLGHTVSRIYEPLILCHWCMPSIHAIVGFLFGIGLGIASWNKELVFLYPLVVMASSFLVGILWGLHQLIWKANEIAEHIETLRFFDVKDRKTQHFASKELRPVHKDGHQKRSYKQH